MNNLELDVFDISEMDAACEFARFNSCNAIIAPSNLIHLITMARSIKGGKYKIICAVDWPKGALYATDKMRGIAAEALNADGFEILLTPNKTADDNQKEIKYLSQFVGRYFPKTTEIRFALGLNSDKLSNVINVEACAKALRTIPSPTLVRTFTRTKMSASESTAEIHNYYIDAIRRGCPTPIKISGGITYNIMRDCSKADKFAVNVAQAKIIKENFVKFGAPNPAPAQTPPPQSDIRII